MKPFRFFNPLPLARATPQRIAISRYILRNHEHPSAQKTYQEVKKTHPTVSLATIYTTIKILKKTGLICELKLPQSQTRYDPNTEPHAHLVCLHCGSVTDWMDPIMQKLVKNVSSKANFTVIGSSDLHGSEPGDPLLCAGVGGEE